MATGRTEHSPLTSLPVVWPHLMLGNSTSDDGSQGCSP